MSGLDPKGPAQPTLDQSYEVAGNPATKEPAQQQAAYANQHAPAGHDRRVPTTQSSGFQDATPTSLGRGVHGAPPGEEAKGFTSDDQFREGDVEGEQMRAPGEGDVNRVVHEKPGAAGQQSDFASDLDRHVTLNVVVPRNPTLTASQQEGRASTNARSRPQRATTQCRRWRHSWPARRPCQPRTLISGIEC